MKKIIISIFLIAILSSCSLLNKSEKIEITSSGETVKIDENTGIEVTSSGETVKIDENGNVNISTNDVEISINGETDVSIEKDIENIIETSDETSKDSVTEEEMLNDIDSLINDIIKSAENG